MASLQYQGILHQAYGYPLGFLRNGDGTAFKTSAIECSRPNGTGNAIGAATCYHGRDRFDVPLLLEQSVMSVAPSAIFLLAAAIRLWQLKGTSVKTGPNYTRAVKILATGIYAGLQVAILVLWLFEGRTTRATIPAAALELGVALVICILSYLDHAHAVAPSSLIALYAFSSLVLDAFQGRTLFLLRYSEPLVWTFAAGLGLKLVLLVLESWPKTKYLKEPYKSLSPEERGGIFNTISLWWINPLIINGYRKLLTDDDLPKISSKLGSRKHRDALQEAWDNRTDGKRSLIWASVKAYKWHFLGPIPFRIAITVLQFSQPAIISRAITYITEPDTEETKDVGVQLIIAAIVVYIGIALVTMMFELLKSRLEVVIRGGFVGLVHNKSLILQDGNYDESKAVTLMSNDTDTLIHSTWVVYEGPTNVVEFFVGTYLLARQVGWACVTPLIFVLIAAKGSGKIMNTMSTVVVAWSEATQKRIAMTSSMLGSVKALKMMGLSDAIEEKIKEQRVEDVNRGNKMRQIIFYFSIASGLVMFWTPVGTFAFFTIKALWEGKDTLSSNQAFTALALISMVTSPAQQLMVLLPNAYSLEACFGRIQTFLLDTSREDKREGGESDVVSNGNGKKYTDEETENGHANTNGNGNGNGNGYGHILDEPISRRAVSLDNVTIRPAKTAEPAIVDATIDIKQSTIALIAGPVGCGKTTLVRAILGELPVEGGKVETSTKRIAYCAQTAWLLNGTLRENISGAIDDADIDQTWYESVIDACCLNRDLSLLADGDRSLIGSRGLVLSGGQKQRVALARAVYARADIVLLDDVLSALDAKTERKVVENLFGPKGLFRKLGTTVFLVTHSTQYFHLADHIVIIGTDKKIAEQGNYDQLRSAEGYISKLLVKEDHSSRSEEEEHTMSTAKKSTRDVAAEAAEELSRKAGDKSVYSFWLRPVGWKIASVVVVANFVYAGFLTFPNIWLKWWTDGYGEGHMVFYLVGYVLLSIGISCSHAVVIYVMILIIAPRTSNALHNSLLNKVMRAPQSFFASTDTGVTLNRFTQDLQLVDKTLPFVGMSVVMQIFKLFGQTVLLFLAQPFMLISIPFAFLVLYFVQLVYLRTSRQMRFMDLEAKAPIYSHFLETLEGLSTIRAFGWQKEFSEGNLQRLEKSQVPFYLMYCIQRWLNLVLDLLVAVLAVVIVVLAVVLKDTTTGGAVGIALNVILIFNITLVRLAQAYTELETSIGAISRLKDFDEKTESEDKPEETYIPAESWPEKGEIEFRDITASYGPDALALRNLSLKIQPGQKIGICGRTGSGKSSLLSTLLRLLDLDSGTIIIDGQDLQKLPREIIRTRMIVIPQDPFILTDSVRVNADPAGTVEDSAIIAVLEKVKLWSIIEPRGGLDESMKKQPLSVGQQQLFCLARAMLRRSKILVLDEATSNVDHETDALMQKIIREEFKEHTIITVAHRLDTILDSDMVAVLDAGALVEFGKPDELLAKEGSVFKSLHGN